MECVLLGHAEYGWEVRLMNDGGELYARRWIMRAEALTEADELRRELEHNGWQCVSV